MVLYEWRAYEIAPGKRGALNDRFQNVTLKLFDKHGIKALGFWEAVVGSTNVLYYMLVWENMAHREKAWNSFLTDPEWKKAFKETEKDGALTVRIVNYLLRPAPFSPMK